MLHEDEHGCGNVGKWVGVLFAALGVGAAFLIVRFLNLGWVVFSPPFLPKEVLVGLVALFIAAAVLGKKAGLYLCGKDYDVPKNVLVGLGVAFGSITTAVLAGTLIAVVSDAGELIRSPDFNPLNLVLGFFLTLLLVLWFAGLPAIFLGVVYGFVVRNRLRELNR